MWTREGQINANFDPVCWNFNCIFQNMLLSNAEQRALCQKACHTSEVASEGKVPPLLQCDNAYKFVLKVITLRGKTKLIKRQGSERIIIIFLLLFCTICEIPQIVWILFWVVSIMYEGWNFNSGNYLFTTDTK